jgi:DNA-binding NtrC family response regulator
MSAADAPVRVLVVDDELLIRWSITESLSEQGFAVSEAGDGKAALRAAAADRPDVVLLDFRLPDSEDLSLLAAIRRLLPTSQIILMTAFGTGDVVDGALNLGAYRVMTKPFEMDAVATVVRQAHAAAKLHNRS